MKIRTLRLLRNEDQVINESKLKKVFLVFHKIKDYSAEDMKNSVLNILEALNVLIQKCYGQGYDGARVHSMQTTISIWL